MSSLNLCLALEKYTGWASNISKKKCCVKELRTKGKSLRNVEFLKVSETAEFHKFITLGNEFLGNYGVVETPQCGYSLCNRVAVLQTEAKYQLQLLDEQPTTET